MQNNNNEVCDTPNHEDVNTVDSLQAAGGSMDDFGDAASLVSDVANAETNGDALVAVLSYRLKVRTQALQEMRALMAAQQGFQVAGLAQSTWLADLVTLQFADVAAAQQFMRDYSPAPAPQPEVLEPYGAPTTSGFVLSGGAGPVVAAPAGEGEVGSDTCGSCGNPWAEHEFAVPAPYCPPVQAGHVRAAPEATGGADNVSPGRVQRPALIHLVAQSESAAPDELLTRAEAQAQTERAIVLALQSSADEIEALKVRLELALMPREVVAGMVRGAGADESGFDSSTALPQFAPIASMAPADMQVELSEWRKLQDPVVLHANLLRGVPARMTVEMLKHLAGVYALGLPPDDKAPHTELEATILQTMYQAFQRGDSVERVHAAVCSLLPGYASCSFTCEPPLNVYFREGNFYAADTREGLGAEFSRQWWGKRTSFPVTPEQALAREACRR